MVASTATVYLFMHPLFTLPASYIITKKGVSTAVNIGTLLTVVGASIRCLSVVSRFTKFIINSFYWILLG